MTNEFNVPLDSNGYAPSLLRTYPGVCFECGRFSDTARHEIFHGPYRAKSKRYGLWVNVCPRCHDFLHRNGDQALKEKAQAEAQRAYGWSVQEFRIVFGKNFCEVSE
jgi:hypothetical protein